MSFFVCDFLLCGFAALRERFRFLEWSLARNHCGLRWCWFEPECPRSDQASGGLKTIARKAANAAKQSTAEKIGDTSLNTTAKTPLTRPSATLSPRGRRERGSEQTNEFVAFFRVSSQIFTWYWARRKAFWGHRTSFGRRR